MASATIGRVPGGGRASDCFSQRLRQHVLVEREVSDEPFQSTVFFELPEPAQFTHAQVRVLLLPGLERGIIDSRLSAAVADRGAGFGLSDRVHDLIFRELGPLYRSAPFDENHRSRYRTLV